MCFHFNCNVHAQAFLYSDQQKMALGPSAFQGSHLTLVPSLHAEQALLRQAGSNANGQNKLLAQLAQHTAARCALPAFLWCFAAVLRVDSSWRVDQ